MADSAYEQFLREKFDFHKDYGFDVDPADLSPVLLPHQADIVRWAIKGGRRAIFASFGLGKSVMQLEILRLIHAREQGRCLIVCPLGVRQEFTRDARELLGMEITFARWDHELDGDGIYITNYESIRDGRLNPDLFDAVSLDEASVLRSYGSKTYQTFLGLFRHTKYRFVATATPDPNRVKELVHYAAFLGIMDSGQALTRWFQRDSTKANNLTLYPHKEHEFRVWLHSWSIWLNKPSDLGYDNEGYDLPPLAIHWHEVDDTADEHMAERDGQGLLYKDATISISETAKIKRDSLDARIQQLMVLISSYDHLPQADGRREAGDQASSISSEPGTVEAATAQERSETVLRTDRRAVQPDACGNGRLLPDMRTGDDPAGCGPRSRDGQGQRSSLPQVQYGDRLATRRPGDGGEGCELPVPVRDQLIVWVELNIEQRAVEAALRSHGLTYSSIDGSLSTDEVELRLEEWRARKTYALIGKPVMLGQGVNLQQCNKVVFLGISYKFNNAIQATHRVHRFGQKRTAEVHFVHTTSERHVLSSLRAKWERYDEQREDMEKIIHEYGLESAASITKALERSLGVERVEISGEGWSLANNDCVEETRGMDECSVDEIVTSIPFAFQYEYTPSYNDFGHTDSNEHFWGQMDFLTPELFRTLKPGRIFCCHTKDRINFGNVTGRGYSTVSPFHAEAIMHNIGHGFEYMGMVTVVTDVVRENNQSYRLGWSEMAKDGTKMGVGSPEYVLIFRKPQTDRTRGYADVPVTKDKADYSRARWQVDAHAFWRSSGDRPLVAEDMRGLSTAQRMKLFEQWTMNGVYDYESHIAIGEALDGKAGMGVLPATFMLLSPGSPHPDVWHDVNRMRTLNGEQVRRGLAMHVCPLQFDITDRLIERYSNPGDLVYDPFAGLGTVPMRALRAGRRGRGVELNPDYFTDSVRYLQAEQMRVSTPSLLDLIAAEPVGAT